MSDLLEDDPDWADRFIQQLRAQSQVHELAITPIIDAELALIFSAVEALDEVVGQLQLTLREVPKPAQFRAGKAFARYRKNGGNENNVLADFFIGAHAAVGRYPLLTRDAKRYRNYFPTVNLITPA